MAGVVGLVSVAAITPGPNNLVVMRVAAHAGFAGALPAIGGILAGGLAMLFLVMAGAGVVFAAEPRLYPVITVCGGLYLGWLGGSLVIGSFARSDAQGAPPTPALPASAAGLFGFQFLNPKSWVMVLTVTAAVQRSSELSSALLPLATVFTVIPAFCLMFWSALGVLMTRWMGRRRVRNWVDRVMGLLLVVSALMLVLFPLPTDASHL